MKLVLATENTDKAREIAEILGEADPDLELVPRPADLPGVPETAATLEANARLKATAVAEATGVPALADDTGLEVDALGGAPGVHSARFAGPKASDADNVAKLLAEMDGVLDEERLARFATVAVVCWPDGREVSARGTVEGVITLEVRGTGGFGYDPVFAPVEGDGRTFGEMSAEEKHAISHRGRAFRALADRLTGSRS